MQTPAPALAVRIGGPTQLLLERNGEAFAIHPLWLRERCRDAASMDLKTQQRLADPSDFDLALKIVALAEPSPGSFRIRFSDGHEATFSAADLLEEAALAPNDHDCPPLPDRKSCFDWKPVDASPPHSNHRSSVLEAATSTPSLNVAAHGSPLLVQVTPASAVNDNCQPRESVALVALSVST